MLNSQEPPKWNTVLDSSLSDIVWNNSHVNTSYQSKTKGYRCIIINDTTNETKWILSSIKYDWKYNASGYCGKESDCFVSSSFDAHSVPPSLVGYSKGCIHDGDFVPDAALISPSSVGTGNHYCHDGSWTTRSYIVATLLQNISTAANKPYILQCYDNSSANHNTKFSSADASKNDNILSTCVLTIQNSEIDEQIITGVILKEDGYSAETFLDDLATEYLGMWSLAATIATGADGTGKCTDALPHSLEPGTNFSSCFEDTDNKNFYVYYETHNKYFLISDRKIDGLTHKTVWERIILFFQNLFKNRASTIAAYNTVNYTTSYDRIYIMRSPTANVTAVEEAKYDELTQSIGTVLYVNYTGSNNNNNPIDRDILFSKLNRTMSYSNKVDIPVNMNYVNDSNSQEVIIRSQDTTGAWQYLNTILRNRK
jgi:hypothetical protein